MTLCSYLPLRIAIIIIIHNNISILTILIIILQLAVELLMCLTSWEWLRISKSSNRWLINIMINQCSCLWFICCLCESLIEIIPCSLLQRLREQRREILLGMMLTIECLFRLLLLLCLHILLVVCILENMHTTIFRNNTSSSGTYSKLLWCTILWYSISLILLYFVHWFSCC